MAYLWDKECNSGPISSVMSMFSELRLEINYSETPLIFLENEYNARLWELSNFTVPRVYPYRRIK